MARQKHLFLVVHTFISIKLTFYMLTRLSFFFLAAAVAVPVSAEEIRISASDLLADFILEPLQLDGIKQKEANGGNSIVPWHMVEIEENHINVPKVFESEGINHSVESILKLGSLTFIPSIFVCELSLGIAKSKFG